MQGCPVSERRRTTRILTQTHANDRSWCIIRSISCLGLFLDTLKMDRPSWKSFGGKGDEGSHGRRERERERETDRERERERKREVAGKAWPELELVPNRRESGTLDRGRCLNCEHDRQFARERLNELLPLSLVPIDRGWIPSASRW